MHDFRKDRFWATKVAFYMLWMEYLAISPSYELARRFRTDGLSPDEVNALPKDFSEVLAVYDDLGDVQRVIFRPWWKDRALAVFGHEGTKPRVRRIDTLKKIVRKTPLKDFSCSLTTDGASKVNQMLPLLVFR